MEVIIHKENNNIGILEITGDIDIYNVPELNNFIKQVIVGERIHAIFDMNNVTYIDSSGIGVFISTLTMLKKLKGSVNIVNPSEPVRKVFTLTKILSFFNIFDDVKTAIASING